MNAPSLSRRAEALARGGEVEAAHALLKLGDAHGDADATYLLAAWHLTGQFLPRNLALSRRLFAKSANAGHPDAGAISIAFLASGTGGKRDWPRALQLLQRRAERDPDARLQLQLISTMQLTAEGDPVGRPKKDIVSESPPIILYRGFLTRDECRYLIDAARPILSPSTVVHPGTGELIQDPIRTSDAATFPLAMENPFIHTLNRRIAHVSGTTAIQGEPLQILRYRRGQEYRLHSDALPAVRNQRIQTMLVYLNQEYAGGETYFPDLELRVRGNPGDALLFRNLDEHGNPDDRARHIGTKVTDGEKLIASRWIRAQPLNLEQPG